MQKPTEKSLKEVSLSAAGRGRGRLGDGDCAEVFNKLDFAEEDVGSALRAVAEGDCDAIVELSGTNGGALSVNGVFPEKQIPLSVRLLPH